MQALESSRVASQRAVNEALDTHPDLSDVDRGLILSATGQLTPELTAALVLMLHRKLLTGFRAREFNYLLTQAAKAGNRDQLSELINNAYQSYYELSYVPDLLPDERAQMEQTRNREYNSLLAMLSNGARFDSLCSGTFCLEAMCVEGPYVTTIPATVYLATPPLTHCFSYDTLIDSLANGINPWTRQPFAPEVGEKYSLDVKIARAFRKVHGEDNIQSRTPTITQWSGSDGILSSGGR